MVFGNKGDTSCSGVAFSRDEITGEPTPSGDFLAERAGRGRGVGRAHAARHARDEGGDARRLRRADGDPAHARGALQGHAGHRVHGGGGQPVHAPDAQREAPRPGGGAVRGRRGGGGPARPRPRRSRRSTPAGSTRCCTRRSRATPSSRCWPRAWPRRRARPRARSCSPPRRPSPPAEDGRDVILVRPFTEADDVAGFHAAKGILTAEGGKASHAALVARGMGKPCVSGASRARDRPQRQDRQGRATRRWARAT